MDFQLRSCIRQGSALIFGRSGVARYCSLGSSQPLLLIPEPGNRKDASAVRLADVLGCPVGYVAREDAPTVSQMIRNGRLLLCRTDGPCLCSTREIFIWSEGTNDVERIRKAARKTDRVQA